uniref:Uncharacterized protein n=1 Tax=Setaria italica TaxID=4555 RepID=K3Y0L1_SETIT
MFPTSFFMQHKYTMSCNITEMPSATSRKTTMEHQMLADETSQMTSCNITNYTPRHGKLPTATCIQQVRTGAV